MKPGWLNAGPDHLSRVEKGEKPTNIDDGFPYAQLFWVEVIDDHYAPIVQFLSTGVAPADMSISQKKQLVVKASNFQLIAGQLYKLGSDEILRQCFLPHEHGPILEEAPAGIAKGDYGGHATAWKVLCAGLWWPVLHNDATDYARSCDVCQWAGNWNPLLSTASFG